MSTSSLRVSVDWKESTVFAGEEIQCQITFKNAETQESLSENAQVRDVEGRSSDQGFSRMRGPAPLSSRDASHPHDSRNITKYGSRHRSVKSLNLPAHNSDDTSEAQKLENGYHQPDRSPTHQHSTSLTSVGLNQAADDKGGNEDPTASRLEGRRLSKNHTRAVSLHTFGRPAISGETQRLSGSNLPYSTTRDPLLASNYSSILEKRSPQELVFGNHHTHGQVTQSVHEASDNALDSSKCETPVTGVTNVPSPTTFFLSPDAVSNGLVNPRISEDANNIIQTPEHVASRHGMSSRRDKMSGMPSEIYVSHTQSSSNALMEEALQNSGQFFSNSNNSMETLMSEYNIPNSGRVAPLLGYDHRSGSNVPPISSRLPETLMMGYAQTVGSFSVDGSLVNQTLFDDVKKKAATGNHGGGVLGVESSRWQGSLIRGLGLGNLGVSINTLFGASELSSIREARGAVNAKNVPLLSTPQTILFVDLELAPGETRSFHYAFRLPKGLPPSHRGKVIKIWYKLIIGVQRHGTAKEHQMRSIELPFRLLGSVNRCGEPLGHDLLSPYILLRERSHSRPADSKDVASRTHPALQDDAEMTHKGQISRSSFLTYVDDLLTRPRRSSSLGLLSPTEPHSRKNLDPDTMLHVKETIDAAIQRSNLATELNQSANRFEIMSNSQRIAVISLARPAYRLGETITAIVDFAEAQIPCYAIHAALQTNEVVDPAIALRSEASISRVTRKSFAKHTESTLYAHRIIFTPSIPLYATPTFITSAICLEWKLIFEFAIPRQVRDASCKNGSASNLLETFSEDERAVFLAAVDRLDCESFEVALPLRVYGAVSTDPDGHNRSEGFAV